MTNQKLETSLELALSVPSSVRSQSPALETGYSPETGIWELIIRYSGELSLPEDVTLVSLVDMAFYIFRKIASKKFQHYRKLSILKSPNVLPSPLPKPVPPPVLPP